MKAKLNKLDKLFGPSGSFSGQIIFYAGIIMLYYSFMAVVLIVLGAFVGFSTEGIKIDFDNKKVKTLIFLFGFLPFGKWIQIKGDERIVVKALAGPTEPIPGRISRLIFVPVITG